MKLKIIALIYFSIISAGSIFSQDSWRYFSRELYEGMETFYYYDTASVSRYGDVQSVNVKVDYVPDRFHERKGKYIDYIVENIDVNCKLNNYKIGDLTVYYNDKENEKVTEDRTIALISKTHADKLFAMLCGKRDKFFECAKLTFAKSYTSQETTTAEKFSLREIPYGISIIVDMRWCDSSIGLTKVELKISQIDELLNETLITSDAADNIKPDWRFIHFDEIEFPGTGLYKAAVLKPDGTELIYGFVTIY